MQSTTGCVVLAICTVFFVPLILATLLGWDPPLPERDAGSPRLLACATAAAYGSVLTTTVPQLVSAPKALVTTCSYSALVLPIVAIALGTVYDRAARSQGAAWSRRPGEAQVTRQAGIAAGSHEEDVSTGWSH
jgi:hypothetical protein